ncbi:unnamed protein product [Enterobius vermicularis]|uniref:Bromo domain-containing protein n=1 Tax=Enterobius vermicularis TaxID=51028 RepID=A0A0N4V7W7_ENTVE|nr:unnamed protein product [Enterobius vermicularis]
MYKVGHSSVPRSATLVYNYRNVTSRSDIYDKHSLDQFLVEDSPCKLQMELPLPVFSNKSRRNTIPVKKEQADSETVEYLNSTWKAFMMRDGVPDDSIVCFQPKKDERYKDFVPFDVEKYHAERLLKAIDLDPKLVNGFF